MNKNHFWGSDQTRLREKERKKKERERRKDELEEKVEDKERGERGGL